LSFGARAEANTNFGTRVVPRVGASLALRYGKGFWGDTRYRIFYGQGIKEPRFDQLYSDQFGDIGNPSLKPEATKNWSTSIEQKLWEDRVKVTGEYFSNRFYNIISFAFCSPLPPPAPAGSNSCGITIPGAPPSFGYFFNTNLARARGVNLSSEARLTRWLSASANYNYDSTRVLSVPDNSDPNYVLGSRLIRRPVNSGNIMLNASLWRMNWNFSGYFTGQRLDGNFAASTQIANPGYALFNLAAAYNVARGFSVYGRLNNLANKQYSEVYGYPALGREFRIGVKYTTRHE
jgi:vitamin B12 transporter